MVDSLSEASLKCTSAKQRVSLEESWSDLTKLGYDESLKLRTKGESREEWSNEVSERLRDFSKLSEEFMSFPASSQQMTAAKCETVRRTSTALGLECPDVAASGWIRRAVRFQATGNDGAGFKSFQSE